MRCSCLQSSAGATALAAKLSDDGSEILVTLNMQCQLLSTSAACAPCACAEARARVQAALCLSVLVVAVSSDHCQVLAHQLGSILLSHMLAPSLRAGKRPNVSTSRTSRSPFCTYIHCGRIAHAWPMPFEGTIFAWHSSEEREA